MTKQEYLDALRIRLRSYPAEFQDEIIETFEGHFQEGLEHGQSDDEIIDSLGTVDDVMDNIRMMHLGNDSFSQRTEELRSSLDSISTSLSHTIRNVSTMVTDSVNTAMKNIESYTANEHPGLKEGTVSVRNGTVLNISGIRKGALDVYLVPGSCLEYRFEPVRGLFSTATASLNVSQDDQSVTFEADDSARLYIKVPYEITDVKIGLLSGDVNMNNLSLDTVSGRTMSGDWEFSDCRIKTLLADTKSGDFELNDTECADIELITYDGDLSLNKTSGNLDARTASGDIDVSRHRGERMRLETMSGDLDVTAVCPQMELISVSGDIDLFSQGRIENISAAATSGDVTARFGDTDYTAVLTTVSGDISNETDLPHVRRSKREWIVGDGLASVFLKSTSGDIEIA